ncbi:NAD(P)H-dependent FMN reductase [Crossiella equi]|uniref:NAD(P)H-dependent FMN reductase n=1 Tax=Crossiella equi TaxID=130796 RepID=A0ABS5ACE8_9PSEU|nr:NAD(P)H-dependent oxidoreductase [Crossiella equi]MBP2474259.1 NAD(P)H-dependent FMN reductase [Crossiella equi]
MTSTTATERLKIAVIISSTREGRLGPAVARWFLGEAATNHDVDLDLVDIADGVEGFAARIADADAFIVVTPEYNHGYPAPLKAAIDATYGEWRAKPVGFVSYGGMSGGLRAVEQLRQVFAEMHAVTVRETVSFHSVFEKFDANGPLADFEHSAAAAKLLLDQLSWFALALREAREKRPYGA